MSDDMTSVAGEARTSTAAEPVGQADPDAPVAMPAGPARRPTPCWWSRQPNRSARRTPAPFAMPAGLLDVDE